jgi:hypothetical protein
MSRIRIKTVVATVLVSLTVLGATAATTGPASAAGHASPNRAILRAIL